MAPRIDKTVFISYRRTNVPWALAISQYLTHNGYDVFVDYTGVASGDFESVILGNIRSRAHFLVLLTPSALERCSNSDDWLRREIESAMDSQRNIVPLMLESFDFGAPTIVAQLTGKLALLKQYNAMTVIAEYFDAGMDKLRTKFLNVELDAVIHPASSAARQAATEQKAAVAAAPTVAEEELTAQQWFERGISSRDQNEKLRFLSNAISLQPNFTEALCSRGYARIVLADLEGAVRDFSEAIRLRPDYSNAYAGRSQARQRKGDSDGELQDYNEAIRLTPDDARSFNNRGNTRRNRGDLDGAIADYNQAIRLQPDYALAFLNRGVASEDKGNLEAANADYDEAIRLKPDFAEAVNFRGILRDTKGDLDGALSDFNEAIRLKPDYALAQRNRELVLKAIAKRSKS
jgi:tetratricopeptide (TPR) repeat protein